MLFKVLKCEIGSSVRDQLTSVDERFVSFPVTIKQCITITAKVVHCKHLCKVEFTVVKYIVEVFRGPLSAQYPKIDLGRYIILSLNLPVELNCIPAGLKYKYSLCLFRSNTFWIGSNYSLVLFEWGLFYVSMFMIESKC